jgi:hypothetical protein
VTFALVASREFIDRTNAPLCLRWLRLSNPALIGQTDYHIVTIHLTYNFARHKLVLMPTKETTQQNYCRKRYTELYRLDLWLTVNGIEKQRSNTSHMLFKVDEPVVNIAAGTSLSPESRARSA